jgi:hypothetical protein
MSITIEYKDGRHYALIKSDYSECELSHKERPTLIDESIAVAMGEDTSYEIPD